VHLLAEIILGLCLAALLISVLEWIFDHFAAVLAALVILCITIYVIVYYSLGHAMVGYFAVATVFGVGSWTYLGHQKLKQWRLKRDRIRSATAAAEALAKPSSQPQDQWYVFDGVRQSGPISFAGLLDRMSRNEIASSHYLWRPGMDDWRRMDAFTNLPAIASAAARERESRP
jgi:hypothetical protein